MTDKIIPGVGITGNDDKSELVPRDKTEDWDMRPDTPRAEAKPFPRSEADRQAEREILEELIKRREANDGMLRQDEHPYSDDVDPASRAIEKMEQITRVVEDATNPGGILGRNIPARDHRTMYERGDDKYVDDSKDSLTEDEMRAYRDGDWDLSEQAHQVPTGPDHPVSLDDMRPQYVKDNEEFAKAVETFTNNMGEGERLMREETLGEGADGGGKRYNAGKTKMELTLPEWDWALGDVSTKGSFKYDEWNWLLGMKWSTMIGCMKRHLGKFEAGERYDGIKLDIKAGTTGCHHLAMVAWNALALMTYDIRGLGEDDRATLVAALKTLERINAETSDIGEDKV